MTALAVDGRARRIGRGLAALLTLLAVEAGVPALLVGLGLVPHALPSWDSITGALTRKDDGQLLLGVLAAGVWLCWAAFTVSLAVELIGLVGRRPARQLPGLGWCQRATTVLVAAVFTGLVTGPAMGTPADRPPLPRQLADPIAAVAPADRTAAPDLEAQSALTLADDPAPLPATTPYTVQSRDTLWAIAAQHLGAGIRYPEIVALNPDAVGPDNAIRAGDVLLLPAAPAATVDVTVTAGETLSGIAATVSGGSIGWRQAWALNAGRAEPDGMRFNDPDVIRPGWTLTLPSAAPVPDADGPAPQPAGPSAPETPTRPETPPASGAPPTTGNSTGTTTGPAESPAAPTTAPSDAAEPGTATAPLLALATSGTLLAGGLLLALVRARRRRQRWRTPGGPVPTTPAELRPAERALRTAGEPALPDVAFLDAALRGLAAATAATASGTLPDLAAAGLDERTLTLRLAAPRRDAPEPWRAADDGIRWTLDRADSDALPDAPVGDVLAPYPLLASIGTAADGTTWLLDLEHAARLAVVGDARRARDLLRYLAAELAHNTWSQPVALTLVGLGEDLASLGRDALACTDDLVEPLTALAMTGKSVLSVAEAARVDVLDGRLRDVESDAWAPRVVLVDPAAVGEPDNLADYLAALPTPSRRSATALVWAAPAATAETLPSAAWRLELDAGGALRVPQLGLDLVAHQLPAVEAAHLAAVLAAAARLPDDAEPDEARAADSRTGDTDDGPGRVTGAASDRPTRPAEAAQPAAEDAALDGDLANWRDPDCPRPRIALLGPIEVRGAGRLPERRPREQWNAEIVAYLALHPRGVTPERLAADLWPGDEEPRRKLMQARQAVAIARTWLGADPVTGAEYLPRGNVGGADAGYRLEGALLDADLFARLRRRARARGPAGIDDLEAALKLVRGEPLDPRRRRPGGYGWLVDTPVDVEYAALIVDVAHEVAARRLAEGEPERAVEACRVALRANTGSDEPLLDLVAAFDAQGDRAEADACVRRILANHDAEVEEDLPPRTAAILFRRQRPS